VIVKVVDASVLAAILFGEPEGATAVQSIADARLVAPDLIDYERANVAVKKARRHPALADRISSALELLSLLPVTRRTVPAGEAFALARQHNLTAYDASYLWLAQTLGAELVTLDGALARIARPAP
jgi:predicted nucleic acid-binding protein